MMTPLERTTQFTTISFDADQTLWDFDTVMRSALTHVLEALRRLAPGPRSDRMTVEKMIRIRDGVAQELKGRVTNQRLIRREAFRRTLAFVGSLDDQLTNRLNAIYFKHRVEDIELYPDVVPALDILAKRYRMGLLTNGNTDPERSGLARRFQFVIFSEDYTFQKPDRRIFEVALEQAGCAPHEMLHVGDSLESDVAGAQDAGIATVWLNRAQRENNTTIVPDAELSTLKELPQLLADA